MSEHIKTKVLDQSQVSDDVYILTLERQGLDFRAGELISLFGEGPHASRDYTIVSGTRDDALDVIYRYIPHGSLTPYLITLQAGDEVEMLGPYGNFTLRDPSAMIYFIGTGTGIAPCRSFLRSHKELNLTIIHGVRVEADLFYRDEFSTYHYQACVSGSAAQNCFHGRLTEWLTKQSLDKRAHFYLCGANEMIYEVTDILKEKQIPAEQIFTEPYYYRADD